MTSQRLFVGYFDQEIPPSRIAGFVSHRCMGVERIDIIRKPVENRAEIYCCCVQFESPQAAADAVPILDRQGRSGKKMTVRPWIQRNGANDRRNGRRRPGQRSNTERRSTERRRHQAPSYTFNSPLAPRGTEAGHELRSLGGRVKQTLERAAGFPPPH